jgi:hypothetical protein
MGSIMGSQNIVGLDYGSNISEVIGHSLAITNDDYKKKNWIYNMIFSLSLILYMSLITVRVIRVISTVDFFFHKQQ